MNKKIGVVSLGCPKNLVDSEIMLGMLSNANYEIVNNKEDANILIVNICTARVYKYYFRDDRGKETQL